MTGLEVIVSNPPLPAKPECCSEPGCTNKANRIWLAGHRWVCNFHLYRFQMATNGDVA